MMATFTGGIQIAVLAFMNEVASRAPWHNIPDQDWTNHWHHHYTLESFGVMVGFIAVGLSMACAAVAAINAAIVCYFSVYLPEKRPAMEGQILISMLVLFLAFALSSLSAIFISTKFDLPFTIGLSILFVAVTVLVIYQVQLQTGVLTNWAKNAWRNPINTLSFLAASAVLLIDGARLYSAVWVTLLLWSGTTGYCIVAALCENGDPSAPLYMSRTFQTSTVAVVATGWIGYSVMRAAWHPKDVSKVEMAIPFVVLALGCFTGAMLGVGAVWERKSPWEFRGWRLVKRTPSPDPA